MENKQLPADVQKPKWKLILHEQCEDPYFEITNGPISLCAPCGFVGETEEGEDAIFKCVADALNHSGIDFHSENKLELEQHIKIMELQYEVDYLKDYIKAHPRIGWVKGAPKKDKPHYAKIPSKIVDGLIYKAIIIPKGFHGRWWAVGDGAYDLASEEIIEYLDESGTAAPDKLTQERADQIREGEKEVNNG